ncbi:MAG: hypothetical protein ACYDEN_05155, partial [Acidimicrobiales bacterium]
MNALLALAVGYALGARSGGRELAELRRSVLALCATEEWGDVVAAGRAQVGAGLRELARFVDGGSVGGGGGG